MARRQPSTKQGATTSWRRRGAWSSEAMGCPSRLTTSESFDSPTSADLLLDTSAAVALVLEDSEAHELVRSACAGLLLGLAGHALLETYSVLTRLPGGSRLSPAAAARVIAQEFPRSVALSANDAVGAVSALAEGALRAARSTTVWWLWPRARPGSGCSRAIGARSEPMRSSRSTSRWSDASTPFRRLRSRRGRAPLHTESVNSMRASTYRACPRDDLGS